MYSVCDGFNVFVACWRKSLSFPGISHVEGLLEPCERGNILQIKKMAKKSGFPFGCGLFASEFPFEAGAALAGEGVCQMNRAFDTMLKSPSRIGNGANSAHG